jgi:hypothetical protein
VEVTTCIDAADALPPITGQDAELDAIQRILAGEQYMTIYKPIKIEAETAAEVAVAIANGDDVGETCSYWPSPSTPSLAGHGPAAGAADPGEVVAGRPTAGKGDHPCSVG